MTVRFLPTPETRGTPLREERENLAEVIEFRSRLRKPEAAPEVSDECSAVISGQYSDEGSRGYLSETTEGCLAESSEAPLVAGGRTAQESAVRLLARKPLSSGELRRALVNLGHPEFDADDAVVECETSLYLDDEDLARSLTRKLRESKGESRSRIRQKLRERHLPDTAIDAALEELDDDDELTLLRQTAEDRAKRMVGLDRQVAERRLLGYLARRGWSGDRATRAVKEALGGSLGGTRGPGSTGGVRFR